MNWEAIQAVAELVAATGVIGSLVYLAAQVRQSAQSTRAAANQDLMQSFAEVTSNLTSSTHGLRIYEAIRTGSVDDLTPAELAAGRLTWVQVLRVFEHAYLQHEAGLLPEQVWEGWVAQMRISVGFPFHTEGWAAFRTLLNPDFALWLERLDGGVLEEFSEDLKGLYRRHPAS